MTALVTHSPEVCGTHVWVTALGVLAVDRLRECCARSAKFWMSANTWTLLLAPFDMFLIPYWGFFSRGDVGMLHDKGSRSIYVDCFWGQVLRKYL